MAHNPLQPQQPPSAHARMIGIRNVILSVLLLLSVLLEPYVRQRVREARATCPTGIDLHGKMAELATTVGPDYRLERLTRMEDTVEPIAGQSSTTILRGEWFVSFTSTVPNLAPQTYATHLFYLNLCKPPFDYIREGHAAANGPPEPGGLAAFQSSPADLELLATNARSAAACLLGVPPAQAIVMDVSFEYDTRFAPAAWRWTVRYEHESLFLRGRLDATTLQPVVWEWFQLSGNTPLTHPQCGLIEPVLFNPPE